MVSLIHRAQAGQVDSTSPISIIRNVADVFEFSGIRAFLSVRMLFLVIPVKLYDDKLQ